MANDDFSEPPGRAHSKNPIFIFADFWVWVTSEARGSVSVGFWGSCRLCPFGRGQGAAGGLHRPPPLPRQLNTGPATPGGGGGARGGRYTPPPPPAAAEAPRGAPGGAAWPRGNGIVAGVSPAGAMARGEGAGAGGGGRPLGRRDDVQPAEKM